MSGLIKSLLYSDRPITTKNMKFEMVKEALLSEHFKEILQKRNADMQKIIIHYKDLINADPDLKSAPDYLSQLEKVRRSRVEKVLSGNSDNVAKERLKSIYKNKEVEDNSKDRDHKHFKVKNDSLIIKITVKEELMYELELMNIDIISNIVTTYTKIPSYKLEAWYESFKPQNKLAYGRFPIKEKGKLILGENTYKSEEILLFHCLTDDHIYLVKRTHLKIK